MKLQHRRVFADLLCLSGAPAMFRFEARQFLAR